jgi:hypothetical protein
MARPDAKINAERFLGIPDSRFVVAGEHAGNLPRKVSHPRNATARLIERRRAVAGQDGSPSG